MSVEAWVTALIGAFAALVGFWGLRYSIRKDARDQDRERTDAIRQAVQDARAEWATDRIQLLADKAYLQKRVDDLIDERAKGWRRD